MLVLKVPLVASLGKVPLIIVQSIKMGILVYRLRSQSCVLHPRYARYIQRGKGSTI